MKRAPLHRYPQLKTFKHRPHFFATACPNPKHMTTDKAPNTDPYYHYSHKANLKAVLTCHQAELTPHFSFAYQQKFVQVHLLQDPDLQLSKPKRAL